MSDTERAGVGKTASEVDEQSDMIERCIGSVGWLHCMR